MSTTPSIVFQNPGIIDIRAATIMGVNVKPSGSNPIGYFGTGLKFAIAAILRNGGSITILAGPDSYTFLPLATDIRGQEFQLIQLIRNDERPEALGFTTELGKQWTAANAYRELHSNCLDEAGIVFVTNEQPIHLPSHTTIIVERCPAFYEAYLNRSDIFLATQPEYTTPDSISEQMEFHPPRPDGAYFYRGIRVGEFPCSLPFTINLLSPQYLTEDRTLSQYSVERELIYAIPAMDDINFQSTFFPFTGHEDTHPWLKLDYRALYASPAFLDHMVNLMRRNLLAMPRAADKMLRSNSRFEYTPFKLSAVQERTLSIAIAFVQRLGYDQCTRETVSTAHLGENILGLYDSGMTQIILTPRAFDQGCKQVCLTLLEECLHGYSHINDYTRAFQDKLLNIIGNLYEELTQESL